MRADCGHEYQGPGPEGGAAGYATRQDGKTVCYPCADDGERERLLTERSIFCYLSSDGKTLTTWTGGKLMTVTSHKTARVGFRGIDGKSPVRHYLQAHDVHGAHCWIGTSPGPGMYARMRRNA
jgi:hypothetical protein